MPAEPISGPVYYREQAGRLREQAESWKGSAYFKDELLKLADDYERLALSVERSQLGR